MALQLLANCNIMVVIVVRVNENERGRVYEDESKNRLEGNKHFEIKEGVKAKQDEF